MPLSKELFFRLSPDLLCVASHDGYFTELSPGWSRVLGWTIEELCAVPYVDFVHPEDRKATVSEAQHLSQKGDTYQFQNRYRTKQGTYRWIEWNAISLPHCIVAVGRDVTERKATSHRISDLERREYFFHHLIENTRDPIYMLTPYNGFRFSYVNEATCRHFGRSREQLLTMSIPDWDPCFDLEKCEVFWERIKKEKSITFETIHRLGSGRKAPVEVSSNYFEFDGVEYISGHIKDITERKQIEESLGQFASVASHDLQEPLRTISSYLELLRRKLPLEGETAEYFTFVTDAADRMRALIRAILSYSKAKGSTFIPEAVPTQDVFSHVVSGLEGAIRDCSATVSSGTLPVIKGDRYQLTQLFQNLITNGLKYRGTSPPHIMVSASKREGEWLFEVTDNGIGIDAADHRRIFDPFQRVHSRSEYPGTGLGLATCRRIVEHAGGRIWVESTLGKGSVFSFTWPVEKTTNPDSNLIRLDSRRPSSASW